MKKLFGLLALLAASNALAFNCRWNFTDFTQGGLNVRAVYITTIAPYGISGTNILTGDRRSYTTANNSSLTVSNMVNGRSYRVEFLGPTTTTTITNNFDTNVVGNVNAVDYLTPPTIVDGNAFGWSRNQADARFLRTNINQYLRQGTNIVYVTNTDGSLTIHGTATGGSGVGVTAGGDSTATTNSGVVTVSTTIPVKGVAAGTNVLASTNGAVVTIYGNPTNLNANNLLAGTIPDARFPAILPAVDGSQLTGITGSGIEKSGGLGTNNNLLNLAYRGNLLSTNAFPIVRATVTVPPNSSQPWMEGYTGDTNAGPFTWRMTAVTNGFNPAVNGASAFSGLSDVQLHYGYNLTTSAGYKANLPLWIRGYESTWFNPFNHPVMEIYDRVTLTNGLLNGTDVGFGYTLGLSNGFTKGAFSGDQIDFRTQFGDGTPWMTFANNTNNEGIIGINKGYIATVATNEWIITSEGSGVIGKRGSNYLFGSGGTYDNAYFFKGANAQGSDLRLTVGTVGSPKSIRWNGTNSDANLNRWEFQNQDNTFTPMMGNPFPIVEIGTVSPTETFILKRNTGTGKLDFFSRQNDYGGYRFNTPNKTNLVVFHDNDGGGGSISAGHYVSINKSTADAALDVNGDILSSAGKVSGGLFRLLNTNGAGYISLYGSTNSGSAVLYIEGSPSSRTVTEAEIASFGTGGSGTFNFLQLSNVFQASSNLNNLASNRYVGTFLGSGGGTSISIPGAFQFTSANGNVADASGAARITIATNSSLSINDTAGAAKFFFSSSGVAAGDGAGITNLDGAAIATGTVADARLASTITRDTELTAPMGYATQNLAVVAFNNNGSAVTNANPTNLFGSGFIPTSKLNTNAWGVSGIVESSQGKSNLVWKTDASGIPAWRADADSGGGSGTNTYYSNTDPDQRIVMGTGNNFAQWYDASGGRIGFLDESGNFATAGNITIFGGSLTITNQAAAAVSRVAVFDTTGTITASSTELSTLATLAAAQRFSASNSFSAGLRSEGPIYVSQSTGLNMDFTGKPRLYLTTDTNATLTSSGTARTDQEFMLVITNSSASSKVYTLPNNVYDEATRTVVSTLTVDGLSQLSYALRYNGTGWFHPSDGYNNPTLVTLSTNGPYNGSSITNYNGTNIIGNVPSALALIAPTVATQATRTNALAVGWPAAQTAYTVTNDCSLTNVSGIVSGSILTGVMTLTNSSGTTYGVFLPAQWGTPDGSRVYYVTNGKMAKLTVEWSGATGISATNAAWTPLY